MDLSTLKRNMINALEHMELHPAEPFCLFHEVEPDIVHFATQSDYYCCLESEGKKKIHGVGCADAAVLKTILHHTPWDLFLTELEEKCRNWSNDYALNSLGAWRTVNHHTPFNTEA